MTHTHIVLGIICFIAGMFTTLITMAFLMGANEGKDDLKQDYKGLQEHTKNKRSLSQKWHLYWAEYHKRILHELGNEYKYFSDDFNYHFKKYEHHIKRIKEEKPC